jgi:hypothetical protein
MISFFPGKVRDRVRHGEVRGAEPFRESAQPRKRPRRDAQGRREQARDREAAQGGAGESLI